ncbi:unnamed protein product [Pleuronectes platessa]|uniref:Uncharacterized protein n=1 Tax=Pleuronectes platessa TaxID=8262 RepID=A0A9N7YNT9_PLEPL|nr:unnamed protein product [Pleuronectes platessa]
MEEEPLNTTAGSADDILERSRSPGGAASCWEDKYHRKLAICSIICGFSCIGINALIHSVKAEKTEDPREKAMARKYGIISILVWVCFLALIPVLLALISYLLTLKD